MRGRTASMVQDTHAVVAHGGVGLGEHSLPLPDHCYAQPVDAANVFALRDHAHGRPR